MIISKSNFLLSVNPTITSGESGGDPSNIVDPDFSNGYTSANNSNLTISFGVVSAVSCVGVAGLNIEGNKDFTSSVKVFDGSSLIAVNYVSSNNCVLLSFDQRTFTDLIVSITNAASSTPPSVNFISAGQFLTVPNNGEMAGYNRQFLNRNFKSKTSVNKLAAPTSIIREKIPAKGTLSIKNVTRDFSEGEWQDFLTFSEVNYFFIREQDGEQNDSAYLCYEIGRNSVKAHAETRLLNDLRVSFMVFNGL